MEPLLGLYTSPNSLQLPSGATLKADNVYLDTDGYFKPFKKVEKVFTDLQLVGDTGSSSVLWGVATYRRNMFLKNGYLFWTLYNTASTDQDLPFYMNTTQIKTTETAGTAEIESIGGGSSRYTDSSDSTIGYATKFFSAIEVADFFIYCACVANWMPPEIACICAEEVLTPFGGATPLLIGDLSIPPPDVLATTYTTPSSRVYDGDAANNTDRFYANAYRFTLSITVGDFLVESKPTGSIYVRGSNASVAPGIWVGQVDMRLPGQIGNPNTNFNLNVYRTPLELADNATTDLVPRESDDFRLVASINFKSTTNSYTFIDDEVMPPGSAELYTNATQEGIIQQNNEIPKFKCSTYYKGYAFYGNIKTVLPLTLNIKQGNTGTYQGFWALTYESPFGSKCLYAPQEYDIDLSTGADDSNFTLGLLYAVDGLFNNYGFFVNAYYANSSGTGVTVVLSLKSVGEDFPITFIDRSGIFLSALYDTLTASTITITYTAHGLTTGQWVFIYFIDDSYQENYVENQITVTGVNTFTVANPFANPSPVTAGNCQFIAYNVGTTPQPSGIFTNITDDGYVFDQKEITNSMVYSKYLQPFVTAQPNSYTVGSSAPILFLANLREYLLILKSDGVYILRGDNPDNFTIDPLYPQLVLTDSRAIQVVDDFVIGLFTVGVVRMNENGYEVISQPIRDDIQNMVLGIGTNNANISAYPPISFYHKSKRLFIIGREQAYVAPDSETTSQGEMFPTYLAHNAFCYHIDSKQWTKSNKIFLDGACEVGNEIYFSTVGDRTTEVVLPSPNPPITVNFRTDIYRTSVSNLPAAFTDDFRIQFVKKLATNDGKGGHFRFLKLYFREMNFTSVTVRYYNNYDFSDNSQYFETTYSDIVTFQEDGISSYSRSVAYLMIPMEAARGEWLSFEIFDTVSSGVDIVKYNGILLEGVELVVTPGRAASV